MTGYPLTHHSADGALIEAWLDLHRVTQPAIFYWGMTGVPSIGVGSLA